MKSIDDYIKYGYKGSEFNKLYNFEIPDEQAKALSNITEEFLMLCCERKFSTLSFFKSVC